MADDESMTKICAQCKQAKPPTEFTQRKQGGVYRPHPYCRDCKNAKERERYYRDHDAEKAKLRQKSKRLLPRRRAYFAAYYRANKERLDAINRHWAKVKRKERVGYTRKWQKANQEAVRAMAQAQRARRRNAPGKFTRDDVIDLLKAQQDRCAYCRRPLKGRYHMDHIHPLVSGGTNHRRNIQMTCGTCNVEKNSKDPLDFARSRGLLL